MHTLTHEEAYALLLELANFPGGPTAALRILGVKGQIDNPCNCPVYNYLSMRNSREDETS